MITNTALEMIAMQIARARYVGNYNEATELYAAALSNYGVKIKSQLDEAIVAITINCEARLAQR